MPILGMGLHVAVALCFAIHAMRTGQDRYWLVILFAFPLVGSLVYGLVVWLPMLRHSWQGQQIVRGVKQALDPTRELRAAQEAFEEAATVERRLRLADALLAAGRASEAIPQYQGALTGIHRDDPGIQVRLATAMLEAGHARAARELLDALIRQYPDFRSQQGHVTYARAVAAEGDRGKAREEFETLVAYASGFEAHVHYAEFLRQWGEADRARSLCEQALARIARMPRHARKLHRAESDRLRALSQALDTVAVD